MKLNNYLREVTKIKYHIIYIAIILVLCSLIASHIFRIYNNSNDAISGVDTLSYVRDTTTIIQYDTLIQEKLVFKNIYIIDTIYIRDTIHNTTSNFPLVQKYYNEPNRYELWISGVEPLSVDKINVFNNVEYRTITNTITQNVYKTSTQFFFGGGFYAFSDTFSPVVGVSLKTKKNTLISLDYGRYDNNNIFLASVKFKIIGK